MIGSGSAGHRISQLSFDAGRDEDRKDFEEIPKIPRGSPHHRINPRKSRHRDAVPQEFVPWEQKKMEEYSQAELSNRLKRTVESAAHIDPNDESDDSENIWIFVTNIVNLQVNFGKSP